VTVLTEELVREDGGFEADVLAAASALQVMGRQPDACGESGSVDLSSG